MKTIFIPVSRGFIMRNILRSSVLQYLHKSNIKTVIIIQSSRDVNKTPEYLKNEFYQKGICEIITVTSPRFNRVYDKIYRIFIFLIERTVYTDNIRRIRVVLRAKIINKIEGPFLLFYSKLHFLKDIFRFIEYRVFYHDYYKSLFEKYNPDLVFSTSIISRLDITLMKEAKRRGLKTVSMPKGWDNITKKLYRFIPDLLIVQNNEMVKGARTMQRIQKKRIKVCGFPQFDWYKKPEIIMSREDYFKKIRLNPNRRLIFFGSEGHWIKGDENIIKYLSELVNKEGSFSKPVSIIIRSHFSDAKSGRFNHYKNIPNIKVDDNFTFSKLFHDNCDPSLNEIKLFVNTLYHSDMVISFSSTLSLDAVCLMRPNINPMFDLKINPTTGVDLSYVYYEHDHFQDVLDTGAIDLVKNRQELVDKINFYLTNLDKKVQNRLKLIDKMCYKVDGKSSERVARVIINMLNK